MAQKVVHIKSKTRLFEVNLKELWQYRDLIVLFFRRNFLTRYKQTVLGPLWLVITPFLTVCMQAIVFGRLAGLAPGGVPKLAFFLCSNSLWSFFARCVDTTANTFISNSKIMSKVYFPRLVMPLSNTLIGIVDLLIKMSLLVVIIIIYVRHGYSFSVTPLILLSPLFVFQAAALGIGIGIITASLTTRYRDLKVLVGFGLGLWMYGTPVVYTLDLVPEQYRSLYLLNPMAVLVDGFRGVVLGINEPRWKFVLISWGITLTIVFVGVLIFNKVEKTFMDTV